MNKPNQAEINIGLVGHVDHGKTSITKMLTGKWTDTHSEELKRGISIRLGYADTYFRYCENCELYCTEEKCPKCGAETKILRRVSFVDAPGHETLMATMLSGAALMQGAMLIIAANEKCPQPRTTEHLMAIKLSGVKQLVVVQNKIDLVSKERALENYKEIKEFLKAFGYENAPIIPVSANLGVNKDVLIYALEKYIKTKEFNPNEKLKMYVVRSFDVNKPGTKVDDLKGGVLGGSIVSGSLKVGDEIEISPGIDGNPIITKVVSLGTELGPLDEARPGGLIAVGTLLDPSITNNDKMRGQVISIPGTFPAPVRKIKINYTIIDRLLAEELQKPLLMNEPLVLTIGTATNIGIISSIRDNIVEMNLKHPAVVEKGQRIAISRRSKSGWRLYGFGIIQ